MLLVFLSNSHYFVLGNVENWKTSPKIIDETDGSIKTINKCEKYKIKIEMAFGEYYRGLENEGVNARYSSTDLTNKQQAQEEIGKWVN